MNKKPAVEQLLAVPIGVAKMGVSYGLAALIQTREVFLPSQSRHEFVSQLRQDKPLSDAEVAVDAIETGQQRDIPELEFIGKAALTKALIRAETDPETPGQVTAQLAETAGDVGIDPELVPLLDDDDAQKAKDILHSYDKVKNLFPNR